MLGVNEQLTIPHTLDLPDDSEKFLNLINRGGLIKPSDIIFSLSISSWILYKRIMDNNDSKSYFLSCKVQRPVFIKCLMIYIMENPLYDEINKITCTLKHSFDNKNKGFYKKIYNVIAKHNISELNSKTHRDKKRKASSEKRTNGMKITKLQSES